MDLQGFYAGKIFDAHEYLGAHVVAEDAVDLANRLSARHGIQFLICFRPGNVELMAGKIEDLRKDL